MHPNLAVPSNQNAVQVYIPAKCSTPIQDFDAGPQGFRSCAEIPHPRKGMRPVSGSSSVFDVGELPAVRVKGLGRSSREIERHMLHGCRIPDMELQDYGCGVWGCMLSWANLGLNDATSLANNRLNVKRAGPTITSAVRTGVPTLTLNYSTKETIKHIQT